MTISRRSLLTGFATLLAAPAIVRAFSLIAVSAPKPRRVNITSGTALQFIRIHGIDAWGASIFEDIEYNPDLPIVSKTNFLTVNTYEMVYA